MKIGKFLTVMVICITLIFTLYVSVSAGTYTVRQTVNFDFSESTVAIRNKLGYTMSAYPYVSDAPVTNVTQITGYNRPTKIVLDIGIIDIDVYYSTDGSTYLYGCRIENIDVGQQCWVSSGVYRFAFFGGSN